MSDEQILSVQESVELKELRQEWEQKSFTKLVNELCDEIKSKKQVAKLQTALSHLDSALECLAYDVEDMHRKVGMKAEPLRNIFEGIAEAIREISFDPRAACQRGCNLRYDVSKIPDFYQTIESLGYEAGFKEALKQKTSQLTMDLDIDID